jgi:spore germination protein KB
VERDIPNISATQVILLTTGCALMLPYTFMPILKMPNINQDVWIVLSLSLVYSIIIDAPIIILIKIFKCKDINDIINAVTNPLIGRVIASLYIILFVLNFITYASIIMQFILTSIIPNTPYFVVLLITLAPSAYATIKGGGVLARISVFFMPCLFLTIITFALFGISDMDISKLLPAFGDSTLAEINKNAFISASRSLDVVILFVFNAQLKKKVNLTRVYFSSIILYIIFMLLILLPIIMVLGHKYAGMALNPYYTYARQVKFYDSLERLQALSVLVSFPGMILRLGTYGYLACNMLYKMVNKKFNKNGIVGVFYVFTFAILVVPNWRSVAIILLTQDMWVYSYIVFLIKTLIPLLLLLTYLIRNSLKKNRKDHSCSKLKF